MKGCLNAVILAGLGFNRFLFKRCSQGILILLTLMTSFGLLGNTVGHTRPYRPSPPVAISRPLVFPLAHPTSSKKEDAPSHDLLASSFFLESWELEAESLASDAHEQPLFGVYASLENHQSRFAHAGHDPTTEAFGVRNHAPMFIFLQVFRL